jgi:hypothetical protein
MIYMRNLMADITAFAEASPAARSECISQIKSLRKSFGWICVLLLAVNLFFFMKFEKSLDSNWIVLIGLSISYIFTISQQMTYESFDIVLKKLEALTARPDTAENSAPEGSGQE